MIFSFPFSWTPTKGKANITVGQVFSLHSAPFFVLGLQYVVAIRNTASLGHSVFRNALMIQYSHGTVLTTTQMPRQRYCTVWPY